MSLPATIAVIAILDVALLGFLAWMMSHPRHLTPHVSQHERAVADRADRGPDVILERVGSG
jgi:hypothetical protein